MGHSWCNIGRIFGDKERMWEKPWNRKQRVTSRDSSIERGQRSDRPILTHPLRHRPRMSFVIIPSNQHVLSFIRRTHLSLRRRYNSIPRFETLLARSLQLPPNRRSRFWRRSCRRICGELDDSIAIINKLEPEKGKLEPEKGKLESEKGKLLNEHNVCRVISNFLHRYSV